MRKGGKISPAPFIVARSLFSPCFRLQGRIRRQTARRHCQITKSPFSNQPVSDRACRSDIPRPKMNRPPIPCPALFAYQSQTFRETRRISVQPRPEKSASKDNPFPAETHAKRYGRGQTPKNLLSPKTRKGNQLLLIPLGYSL